MALDWSKEITFSGLKKGSSRAKAVYPSKTYMNLVVKDQKTIEARRAVPVAILLILLVAAFVKFGIYDFYDRVNQKQVELAQQQQTLTMLEEQLVDYDAVLEEYEAYESSRLSTDENTVSVTDALALVDRYIAPSASIASIDVQGNTISLNLSNISLDRVGDLVSTLYTQPIVSNVSVSTAATEQTAAEDVTAAMVVTLQKVGDGQ
ncbi:MAG: hypothetical protein IJ111_01995 [Eggerthellaceae bacterium]|nr:hypothetical protein [Eggerthellaceae bacterium]